MKIILAKDMEKLGQAGQAIKAADGYARNYLIPKGIAYPATEANLKKYQEIERLKIKQLAKEKEAALLFKDKLDAASCTVLVETGEDDKLFGSVTSLDVVEALAKEGITVDKKKIMLDESIRQLGVAKVSIKLHPEVIAEVKVWVMKR
ncbi:MAG: 50S ribosomal protein L9 [Candidatus Omnitrophica bacterium]|nr:50S ribosomal protein L9 [Candidatus Omnitrophota bacterium]MCK4423541.1 50S ribosomal protein L9 [Candidatus Omnitrophota bacterium]